MFKSERIDGLVFFNFLRFQVVSLDKLAIDEESFDEAISPIEKFSIAVLHIELPIALIKASILPVHFSVPASQIVLIVAFVEVATDPSVNAVSLLLVILELSFIFIACSCTFFPYSVSASHSIVEMSFVIAAVFPIVLSKIIEFSLKIGAFVKISVLENFGSFPTLHEVHKISFVSTAMRFSKDPKAVCLTFFPLSQIGISFLIFPHSSAMLQVIQPFSLVHLSIPPRILSLTLHLAVLVTSLIDTAICEFLMPQPRSHIISPFPLVGLTAIINHDADPFPFVVHKLAIVHSFLVLLQPQMRRTMQSSQIDLVGGVCFEIMEQFFVGISVAVGGGHD